MPQVLVPPARFARWVANVESAHGRLTLAVRAGELTGLAEDGSDFVARLPFGTTYAGPAEVDGFLAGAVPPADWGVLLVRKGGFAIARLNGATTVADKVGRRHVQGRSKAGGQSQQRFARRRGNQARAAYEAAADHAARLLAARGGLPVVLGGDRGAVRDVLVDPRLRHLDQVGDWLPVPEPRRAELVGAIADAGAIVVRITNAAPVEAPA